MSWTSVEAYIERSRITGRVRDPLLRQVGPDRPVRGVALMDRVKARFDWSDHDPADALGVWQSVVSRYRISAVPTHQVERLRTLARLSPAEVGPPRRRVPKRGAAGLPPYAKERAVGRDRQAGACKGSAVSERRDPKLVTSLRSVSPLAPSRGGPSASLEAVTVALEHMTREVEGESASPTLRTTQASRGENGEWRLILRHANVLQPPTTSPGARSKGGSLDTPSLDSELLEWRHAVDEWANAFGDSEDDLDHPLL